MDFLVVNIPHSLTIRQPHRENANHPNYSLSQDGAGATVTNLGWHMNGAGMGH